MIMDDTIFQFIGKVIAFGGGGAAVAFLTFRFLGKSWIESKFAERLENFKHEQNIQIQRLRIEIDSRLSGVLKLQEKEFETLPEAWSKLDEAYAHVADLVSPLQYHPKLDDMTDDRLQEFLDETNLQETEKNVVRDSSQKANKYQESLFWHRLHRVQLACNEFHKCIVRNGIFFPPSMKEKFDRIARELNSAVSAKAVGQETKDYVLQKEAWETIKDEIEPMFQEIANEIHARLQSHSNSQNS